MRPTNKTWTQLTAELEQTFVRWRRDYTVESVLKGARASKARQTFGERSVVLRFSVRGQPVNLQMSRADRAVDNLALLVQIAETLRMNEVRKLDDVIRDVYRKVLPQARPSPEAESGGSAHARIPEPYRLLGVLPDAPWPVVEAAYRAQAKLQHPDAGGSTRAMQRINAAMEQLRKERADAH